MAIQVLKPQYRTEECLAEIKDCLDKGWTGLGYKTIHFEEAWKEYTGFNNAYFVNSATSGLHLAVKILKMKYNWIDGDECITTPISFISGAHAISYENIKVVFADIDKYLCLDPEDIIKKITNKTKAILYVGIAGNCGEYHKIVNICREHNLKLILDAAHMAGTRYNGEIIGKEADVVIYSFQAVKNLPTADSGMVCFKHKEQDELARKLAWLGINKDTYSRSTYKGSYKWKYTVDHIGYKYHGNSIMAAIGLVQLKYLDQDNAYRRQLSIWYTNNLKNNTDIDIVPIYEGCESSSHIYIIKVPNRDELLLSLNQHEIYPGVHYEISTAYDMYTYDYGTCPKAEKVRNNILSLPLHLGITKKDVDFVCEKLIENIKIHKG